MSNHYFLNQDLKYKFCFLLLFGITPFPTFGQYDYFATDSSSISGIKLVDGGDVSNAMFCQVRKGNEVIKYTPSQIDEYGFYNGKVFLSKEIMIAGSARFVFLELLTKGNINLYYYSGSDTRTYFLEKGSTPLVELPKNNQIKDTDYKNSLLEMTSDCANVSDAIKLVSYKRRPLSKLISYYNRCEIRPLPVTRYGISAGYEATMLNPSSAFERGDYPKQIDYKYDPGYTVGLFIDNPILVSDFSLHVEVLYSQFKCSYHQIIGPVDDINLDANTSSLNIPVLLRYTFPSNTIRPFLNVGGYYTLNLKNEYTLLQTLKSGSGNSTNIIEQKGLLSKYYIGVSMGGGMEYIMDYRRSLFLEFRYNMAHGTEASQTLNKSVFQIFAGVAFHIAR